MDDHDECVANRPEPDHDSRDLSVRPVRGEHGHGTNPDPSDPADSGIRYDPARVLRMRPDGLPQGVRRRVRGVHRRVVYEASAWDPSTDRYVHVGSYPDAETAGHVAESKRLAFLAEAQAAGLHCRRRGQKRNGIPTLSRGVKNLDLRIKRRNADGTLCPQAAGRINSKIRQVHNASDALRHPARIASIAPYMDTIEAIMDDAELEDMDATIARLEASVPVSTRRECFALPRALDPLWPFCELVEYAHGKTTTMDRLARIYGVSRQRVEQIEVRVCALFRAPLRAWAHHRAEPTYHVLSGGGDE